MAQRAIVTIQKSQCLLCGNCLSACPDHALAVGEEAVYLVDEALCRGDGLCVEVCSGPLGLVVREAKPFDEAAVERRLRKLETLRALGAEV
jgi:Pyruvate/2-oxoacid:ferredoxin oxidoreductase delta subunit